jgi:hypothetical protein
VLPEWLVQAWAQIDMWHRAGLLAALVLFLWSVEPALSQRKVESKPGSAAGGVTMGNTTIVNNGGAIQLGGQGNTQNNTFVNASARYESKVTWGHGKLGDDFVTDVRFTITPNRPWDASARTTLGVKLSGPYESREFVGSPFGWTQMAIMTQENKEGGFLQYSTATPPAGREVVLRFKSKQALTVVQAGADPVESTS